MLDNIKQLTQIERQQAESSAKDAVKGKVGDQPKREQFKDHSKSKYPPWVTRLIAILCLILLLAAFTPSAIRLYVIGSTTFGEAIPNDTAMQAVGIATILTAEIGQVVFSLALATLGAEGSSRRLLYISMAMATAIALVGNVQIALFGHWTNPFAWLEAIIPPLLVLSTAFVLKNQVLDAIKMRHANELAFQDVLSAWKGATDKPEEHPNWMQFYANALQDAIRKKNNRRKDTLAALSTEDWRALIYRELQAENWYQQPDTQIVQSGKENGRQSESPFGVNTKQNKK